MAYSLFGDRACATLPDFLCNDFGVAVDNQSRGGRRCVCVGSGARIPANVAGGAEIGII